MILTPLITGISYELIKYAAKRQGSLMATLTAPGLWMQRITTKQPSDDQAAVAIHALEGAMALEKSQGGQLVIDKFAMQFAQKLDHLEKRFEELTNQMADPAAAGAEPGLHQLGNGRQVRVGDAQPVQQRDQPGVVLLRRLRPAGARLRSPSANAAHAVARCTACRSPSSRALAAACRACSSSPRRACSQASPARVTAASVVSPSSSASRAASR